jgi:hypothetical protein
VTKKKDIVWFALSPDRPLFAFVGNWTEWDRQSGGDQEPDRDRPASGLRHLDHTAERRN